MKREKEQIEPNYDELCRRFLADNKDFSKANLERAGINHYYENNDLQECTQLIQLEINTILSGV